MSYDVIVVGGGITGAGILRDCALRGLKALLLERGRAGRATTAASTHLIHGGLRYLLYDRLTTHTTAWDSGNIVRIAPAEVRRLPILWPIYRGSLHGPETVEALLECYDRFQPMKLGLPHLRLGARAARELVPGLRSEGLVGAVSFDEWWVDAEGLVEAHIASARRSGAEAAEGARVTGLVRSGGEVRGVEARLADGSLGRYEARVVVNASGPWVDEVARLADDRIPLRLRKGTHPVYDRPLTPYGLLLEAADRERYVFVIPFPGGTLVGPTDLPAPDEPDRLAPDEDEVRYLLDSARRFLPGFPPDHARTLTGARPILGQRGAEKLLSREYEIIDHARAGAPGLLSAAGGKMSDFRLMAKDAVDLACRRLGKGAACRTHLETLEGRPLPEPPVFPRPWRPLKKFLRRHPHLREAHAMAYLGVGLARHLFRRMGGMAPESTAEEFVRHYRGEGKRAD